MLFLSPYIGYIGYSHDTLHLHMARLFQQHYPYLDSIYIFGFIDFLICFTDFMIFLPLYMD